MADMMRIFCLILLCGMAFFVSACGNKGELTLPPQEQEAVE